MAEKILYEWDKAKLLLLLPSGETLINTRDNHYKFWNVGFEDDKTLRMSWGRIGKAIQFNLKTFYSHYSAEQYRKKIINTKLNKGYEELT